MIGDLDGGVCSNKLTGVISYSSWSSQGTDGGAATTRELGRTLRLRICIDRGLYAGHKTVVRLLLEREQIPRQQLMATEMRCCTR